MSGTHSFAADEAQFAELTEPHRRALHMHSYRMLASFEEAEDAVQETFLRAWRSRGSFDGSMLVRAWLYRVATNVCIDMIRSRKRRLLTLQSFAEVPWLQPYPDRLLDDAAVDRETIELAFIAAMQLLPPRQRAALIARDVLGYPASETAELLQISVPASNSALQRARATMQSHLPSHRESWAAGEATAEELELLDRFIDAHERQDAAAAIKIASTDLRVTMPPHPHAYDGIDAFGPLLHRAFDVEEHGEWRLVPTMSNRMPTAASYLRRRDDTEFRAFKFDVLRIEHGLIVEITTFGVQFFAAFDLPLVLDE